MHLSDKEKEVAEHLSFIAYSSPSDAVNIEIPEIATRNGEEDTNGCQENGR